MPHTRTQEEVNEHFQRQLCALKRSCEGFDNGVLWEASRIATSIDILVHDRNKRTNSIITQLGIRGKMRFVSSGRIIPGNLAPDHPLTYLEVANSGARHIPKFIIFDQHDKNDLLEEYTIIQFHSWWDQPIFKRENLILSRKNLVMSLRDQDGGAHFDAQLSNEAYIALSKTAIYSIESKTGSSPILGAEAATMRQIAWEFQKSIDIFFKNSE